MRGFRWTFAMGVACRQGTLTLPKNWSVRTCIYFACCDHALRTSFCTFSILIIVSEGFCLENVTRIMLTFKQQGKHSRIEYDKNVQESFSSLYTAHKKNKLEQEAPTTDEVHIVLIKNMIESNVIIAEPTHKQRRKESVSNLRPSCTDHTMTPYSPEICQFYFSRIDSSYPIIVYQICLAYITLQNM